MQTPDRHISSVANGNNNTIHNDTPYPHSDYSDATSPTKPSLLRIGLSAGYVSLSQKKQSSGAASSPAAKQGYSTTATAATQIINDKPINNEGKEKKSLLSSPTEEASTLAYIQDAQNIISSNAATTLCKIKNNVEDDDDGAGGGEDVDAAAAILFLSNKLPVPHDVAGCALFQNVLLLPDILPPTPAVVGVWDVVVADSIMLLPGVGGGDDMPVFIARFCD